MCELSSLIEAIFSSQDEGKIAHCLHGGDAQTFIDVIDEVCMAEIWSSEIDIDTLTRH